ncbi:MAG: dihydroorotate dehydrogenase-like protein [Bacteroidota bacterium]
MDLTTKYLGMTLKSPLMVGSSPLSEDIGNIRKMEDAGAAAVVLHSLFEEQLVHEQHELHYATTMGTENYAEMLSFFPEPDEYRLGPEEYLNHIKKAKEAVDIPIIASLNGASMGGWTEFAKKYEEAGADAIELNIYSIPNAMNVKSEQIEQNYIDILTAVKKTVNIPIALKISPFFSNMAYMGKRFEEAGADALVLFNRFYQPDINLAELEVEPHILLSHSTAMRLPLRWIAILKDRINVDFAATSGINSGFDVLKLLMVGANVTQLCSTIYKHGIGQITTIHDQMAQWLEEHEYESVQIMQGSMCQKRTRQPEVFERAQYMKALTEYKLSH